MNKKIIPIIQKIISLNTNEIIKDPQKFKGLLNDRCGTEFEFEKNVLLFAMDRGIPARLLTTTLSIEYYVTQQAQVLKNSFGINEDVAKDAVEFWAIALGVIKAPLGRQLPFSWKKILIGLVFLMVSLLVILGWRTIRNAGELASLPAEKHPSMAESVKKEIPGSQITNPPIIATTETPTASEMSVVTDTPTPENVVSPEVTPQFEPAMIEPYCNRFKESPIYVKEHQPVTLWWRWDASTKKEIQDHLNTAKYVILLDSEQIFPDYQNNVEFLREKNYYRVSWYANVGTLSPGKHKAERKLSWDRKISDGWNTYGPGGQFETIKDYCEIIVR